MSEPQEETVKVEESKEETNYLVVDPDDYQRTKKLENIHNAKKEILKVRSKRMKLVKRYSEDFSSRHSGKTGLDVYQQKLAQTVAHYGSELLPIIEEGLDKNTLDESDLEVELSPNHSECDLLLFIEFDGRIKPDDELRVAPEINSMAMYRQLERIERKLGLGLDIEEQKGAAEI